MQTLNLIRKNFEFNSEIARTNFEFISEIVFGLHFGCISYMSVFFPTGAKNTIGGKKHPPSFTIYWLISVNPLIDGSRNACNTSKNVILASLSARPGIN